MSELGGGTAVGIESVEWVDGGGGNLTVRVTGRWRRRRGWAGAESRGQPVLVVESEGRRHRFPATPEPPSLAGTAPGMWRMSFSVPGALAPVLGGHVWLAFGSVTVPLPTPETGAGPSGPAAASPGPASREGAPAETATAADLEIERAWRRAEEAERASAGYAQRVAELQRALDQERRERASASASLAERDRRRREAEQRAHSEEALREELARRLRASDRESARAREARGELAAAEERIRGLEASLREARRRGDEAERAAATARAARERAEAVIERSAAPGLSPPERAIAPAGAGPHGGAGALAAEEERLRFEDSLRRRRVGPAPVRVPAEPPALPAQPRPDAPARESDLVAALRRELAGRVAAEAELRARTVRAETRLATRVLLDQRTTATLRELREELDSLRATLQEEGARRREAEEEAERLRRELGGQRARSRDAYEAIGALRGALEELRPSGAREGEAIPSPDPAPRDEPGDAGAVTPDRLAGALARLRETTEPRADGSTAAPEAAPAEAVLTPAADEEEADPWRDGPGTTVAGPAGPSLERAFRALARRDPDRAGWLLVDLLGAQRSVYHNPIAYDLVLGPGNGCVQVTLGRGEEQIKLEGAARSREQVDFQVVGGPGRLARLLAAGAWRRRLRIGIARVRGRRDGVAALRALLTLPLDLRELWAAGARPEAETVLALAGAMIDPDWTEGERFIVAHEDGRGARVSIEIRDGQPPVVSTGEPSGRVATTITGSVTGLLGALGGDVPGARPARISGDQGPLALLREWLVRAQHR